MAAQLQYLDLSDFTPGIYSYAGVSQNLAGLTQPTAPLGAAQPLGTYRCFALQSGGLAPLPARVGTFTIPQPDLVGNRVYGPFVVGLFTCNSILATSTVYDEIVFVGVEYITNITGSNRRRFRLYRLNVNNNPYTTTLITSYNSSQPSPLLLLWGMSHGYSRVNATTPTSPGIPLVAYEWNDLDINSGNIYLFPDPAAPSTDTPHVLTATAGQVICHQNRIIQLQANSTLFGTTGLLNTNEQTSFTDPPNSETFGTQDYIFSQEYPFGYGAWGSISAGELLLIKNRGGAVLISGDVANPVVTRLPGVTSTGGAVSLAASCPSGLVYSTAESGLYVWNGGSTSQKISSQLDDGSINSGNRRPYQWFSSTDAFTPLYREGVEVQLSDWFDFVMAPNNYLYDTVTNGWWRIENYQTVQFDRWCRGQNRYLFGSRYGLLDTSGNPNVVDVFDKRTAASNFSWTSHAIPTVRNQVVDIMEVVLVAHTFFGGTVAVSFTDINGNVSGTLNFTIPVSSQPVKLRQTTGTQITGMIITIVSDGGSNPAPIVHALSVGFSPAHPVSNN